VVRLPAMPAAVPNCIPTLTDHADVDERTCGHALLDARWMGIEWTHITRRGCGIGAD
jgi:hypothetical protein